MTSQHVCDDGISCSIASLILIYHVFDDVRSHYRRRYGTLVSVSLDAESRYMFILNVYMIKFISSTHLNMILFSGLSYMFTVVF